MTIPTTGSVSARPVILDTGRNLGLSIGGMPSRGGPPDMISSSETDAFEKSVFGHSARLYSGKANAASPAATASVSATISQRNLLMAGSFPGFGAPGKSPLRYVILRVFISEPWYWVYGPP
jgi:hypothetical protein